MFDDNPNNIPDFSDIPALGDAQGLENYLNNEALAAQGLQPAAQPAEQPAAPANPIEANPAQPAQPAVNTAQPDAGNNTITLTREQFNAILASRGQAPVQPQPAQPQPQQPKSPAYTAQEQQFIANALAKGYSLQQINDFLVKQKGPQGGVDQATAQRIAAIENYLRTQEYKAAETAFVTKLSDFGNKWGLSEQDLVTFGNEALKHGINIAMGDVNLETVFRAVYPEQYAIRSRRMTPTTSSQIYGGTSIPEGNRATASKLEDQYVDAFLKGAMPNQYAASKK